MSFKRSETEQFDLPNEEWRDIFGYPQAKGFYWISNLGRQKRLFRGRYYYTKGGWDGEYRAVTLCVNGWKKTRKIHDLVFEAFYRKLQPNEICHHINEIKDCNIVTNLVAYDLSRHASEHASNRSVETRKKMSNSAKIRVQRMNRKDPVSGRFI